MNKIRKNFNLKQISFKIGCRCQAAAATVAVVASLFIKHMNNYINAVLQIAKIYIYLKKGRRNGLQFLINYLRTNLLPFI